MTCVIKDNVKFYPQVLLEKALSVKKVRYTTKRQGWFMLYNEKKEIESISTAGNQYEVKKR